MKSINLAMVYITAVSVIGIISDFYFKKSSTYASPFTSKAFLIGLGLYCANAFAWVIAMQHAKLAIIGAVYCVVTILLLAAIGHIFFNETLNTKECVGVLMAIGSVILLFRFA